MLEAAYQRHLKRKLERMFPDCFIMKLDSSYRQGVPDLIILYEDMWAVLEVKKAANEPMQPNQEYYVGLLGGMSFAAFIHPGNEREILRDLQQEFEARRAARLSQCEQTCLAQVRR